MLVRMRSTTCPPRAFYCTWGVKEMPYPTAGPGRENVAAAEACRALIVFNHVSYMDPIALVHIFPPSGLANTAVANIPFVGAIVRARAPLLQLC